VTAVFTMVAAVLGVAGVVGAAWAVARTKGIQVSMQIMATANTELRAEVEDGRRALQEERVECARITSHLQGQIDALTGGLAERLLIAMGTAVATATKPSADATERAAHLVADTATAAAVALATAKEHK
jgi:hypothetical protein